MSPGMKRHHTILMRYQTVVTQVRQSPTTLFALPKRVHRIVAYLALVAPATRTCMQIQHGAHTPNATPDLLYLSRAKIITRVWHPTLGYQHALNVWSSTETLV